FDAIAHATSINTKEINFRHRALARARTPNSSPSQTLSSCESSRNRNSFLQRRMQGSGGTPLAPDEAVRAFDVAGEPGRVHERRGLHPLPHPGPNRSQALRVRSEPHRHVQVFTG